MRTIAVIPALNEERAIEMVIRSLPADVVAGVVVVDGGSSDRTRERAAGADAMVVTESRRGYGRACLAGARAAADADVILYLDGDGSDVGQQARRLVAPIVAGRFDLVLGSRVRGHREPGALAAHQRTGNRLVAQVLNARFGLRLTDVGPFRAIRSDVLWDLELTEMTYGWPTQMIRNAACRGHRITELPVDYRRRVGGRSKVSGDVCASARAGWQMLRVAFG
jgi:glycosyltransferase involved in cell wall biosynthesis